MNLPIPAPRPAKRARVTDKADSVPFIVGTSGPSPLAGGLVRVPLKRERSPSPPFESERRLVTSGTKRFTPLPTNCLPSCPQYRRNPEHWAARHVKELEALNLIPERKMIRDDGLVIDWKSIVPVWSDSLKPATLDLAATITLAHQTNAQRPLPRVRRESSSKSTTGTLTPMPSAPIPSVPDSGDTCSSDPQTRKKLPVPPRPSLMRRKIPVRSVPSLTADSSPINRGSSSPTQGRCSLDGVEVVNVPRLLQCRQTPNEAIQPSGIANSASTQHPPTPSSTSESCGQAAEQSMFGRGSSAAEDEMSNMTLDFLRRYIQTYEADRASLASAYARNASFAYRVHKIRHDPDGNVSSIQQTSSGSTPKRSRLEIVTALLTLPSLHSTLSPNSGGAQIHYDIFYLGEGRGMFVVCRGVLSGKTVVHNLILQKKEADPEDAVVEGIWQLVAAAHQILVFES